MNKIFALEGGGSLSIKDQGAYYYIEAIRPNDGKGLYRAVVHGLTGSQALGTLTPEGEMIRLARMIPRTTLERWSCFPITGGECQCFFVFGEQPQREPPPKEPEPLPFRTFIKEFPPRSSHENICHEERSPEPQPRFEESPTIEEERSPLECEPTDPTEPPPQDWRFCHNPAELVAGRTLGEGFEKISPVLYRKRRKGFSLAVPIRCEEEFTLTPLLCLGNTFEREGESYIAFCFDSNGKPCLEKDSPTS
ncbi:MAG: hypothetical protein R3Y07_10135 [Eubacteriales bacterium]